MTESAASEPRQQRAPLVAVPHGGKTSIVPVDFEQAWRLATVFAASGDMVPKVYRENPNAACMAIMWGMELGISPIQAIQGIAVIGGKPAVWGDLLLAICVTSPKFVDLLEEPVLEGTAVVAYKATAKRQGRSDVVRIFTMADAAKAGLLTKDGPWKTYPQRMLQMRARSWALRDQFADALRGIASADEMQDVIEGEFTAQATQRERAAAAREPIREPQPKAAAPAETSDLRNSANSATVSLPAPEPDLLGQLAGVQVATADPVAAEQAEHAAPAAAHGSAAPQGQPAGVDFSDLENPADLAQVPERKPLTKGDQRMLQAYLDTASAHGVTEQDLFDELGDSVHKANLPRALTWLQGKCADAQGQG